VKVCPVCHREFSSALIHCSDDGVPLVDLSTEANLRPEDLVGRIIEGRYKIEKIIGKGGMGTVYACRHVVVGKVAAMKVLKTGVERSDGVLQRFVREAQTANLLRSRHIVEVSDFGQLPSGAFFVVMELLEGKDLGQAMRQGVPRPQLAHIFGQVAETLQIAHEKGIVHRDLKPDNVFLVNEAGDPLFVKLLDFGIAKILHGESSGGLTETGVILGTPYYMSPEQARAEAVDHRSDIYSLGVMMYRAFTGRLPFLADSTMGVLTRHITETPEAPSKLTAIDGVTERLILRCMEKRPENRFQSMREVAEMLRQIPTGVVPQIYEQPTVHEGRGAAPQATGAGYAAAASGAYAQPSGPYAPAQPSGAYAPAQPSGAYAPPQPSGAYAPPQPSGAYAPAQPSGAYPPPQPSGAYAPPQPSGAYPQAAQSGPYASASGPYAPVTGSAQFASTGPQGATGARPSAPFPQQGGYDARVSSAPAGGHAAPPAIVGVVPHAPGAGDTSTSLHMPGDGALASGETSRGLAATGVTRAPRGTSPTALVLGAVAMAILGALGAVFLYRTQFATPAAGGPAATGAASASAAPVSTTAATATASASASATATATAAPAATPATPAPTTEPTPVTPAVGPRPHGRVPTPAPTATASAAAKRPPPRTDIRSPFE
jgi:predicted Ser/Thr protein kinase